MPLDPAGMMRRSGWARSTQCSKPVRRRQDLCDRQPYGWIGFAMGVEGARNVDANEYVQVLGESVLV